MRSDLDIHRTAMVKACGAGDLKARERRLKCSRCGGKEA